MSESLSLYRFLVLKVYLVVPGPFVEKIMLFSLSNLVTLVKSIDQMYMDLLVDSLNSGPLIHMSILMPVLQFWILCLCSKLWLQEVYLPVHFFFKIVLVLWVPCVSIWSFILACLFLQKKSRWNFYNNCSISFYILLKCFPPLFPSILYSGEFLWLHLLN